MGGITKELKSLLNAHFITNVVLSLVFFILKTSKPLCDYLFEDCSLEVKEWEYVTFLGCIIVMKNRKQTAYVEYVGIVCMFAKVLNLILFYKQNPVYAIVYAVLCLLQIVFVPAPMYTGPEDIIYFRDSHFEEELERDKRVTWVVTFFAAWSPACVNFAGPFANISSKYALENLKFGKIDVTRYPKIANKYDVNASAWSKELPTVILFRDGQEWMRYPLKDSKGRVVRYIFNEDNVIRDLALNEIYNQCKAHLSKRKKRNKEELTENTDDKKEK
ncbi:thioredoxin-related transmembrane protein 2-A-like [Liolophura sinensis]|uniref:thioredoxin-related transmembrane protein 2-A-like n=1 Tax=Liolophura sinensis TaxID=3198878 RepID=UPI003158549A